ncbi:MAG: glutamine-hydrolyzing carbamoyl-phosphate synthase small subunit [Peptococcaceae bacterium]
MSKANLVLEDGTVFSGRALGSLGKAQGEIVFNTSMVGYQEILTDPSYAGEIINFTYPLLGNYGTNNTDWESKKVFARGIIVKEGCADPSSWRADQDLQKFLTENELIGLAGIDTRAVTKHLRTRGTMAGIICNDGTDVEELLKLVKQVPALSGQKLIKEVSTPFPYILPGGPQRVVVMDFGVKNNSLRKLQRRGCTVIVVPADMTAPEILKHKPDGILLSNGPGDPQDVPWAVETIKELITRKLPIFGICMGHQLLGLALGGETYKLKFGHRGGNHPVKDLRTGKVYITSQNHGFAVNPASLNQDVEITHMNLNDNTVEGLRHKSLPLASVQYHPEAAPGPQDSAYLFEEFLAKLMSK